MVPRDFKRLDPSEAFRMAAKEEIGLIICPEFVDQMNRDVEKRLESARIMRQ